MRLFKKILLACTLAGTVGWAANVMAADKLPDSKMGGTTQGRLDRDKVCTRCHDETEPTPLLTIYQTKHGVRADSRAPNCQSCHGESEKHLHGDPSVKGRAAPDIVYKKGTYSPTDEKARSAQCITCHEGGIRTHWDGSQHQNAGVACNNCHSIHKPADPVLKKAEQREVCFNCHKTQRAETHKLSTHPLDAGKVACSDCHNPHGSPGPKLLVKKSINETCYTCHAEKRGPFLWEHQPVADDCTNCHTPHGSVNTPLLKTRAPFLCQQCHQDHGATIRAGSALPGSTATQRQSPIGNGRMCLNCHVMIHGSNSPGGTAFNR